MKLIFYLVIIWITASSGFAQPIDTIKVIYEILAKKDNTTIFQKEEVLAKKGFNFGKVNLHLMDRLRQYTEQHPDLQAKVFSVLLINNLLAGVKKTEVDFNEIDKAITQAMLSNNNYITANAYWLYGRIHREFGNYESMLVYYNTALELFEDLPIPQYAYLDNMYFDIAHGLYLRSDFRNSITYGHKAFRRVVDKQSRITGLGKIYLLDILGAAYKEVDKPDSSILFYSDILTELRDNGEMYEDDQKELWISIAEGKIGENYVTQGKLSEAEPLINKYYHESILLKDTLNILLAKNAYAFRI